jgi:hypothetical protein
MCSAYRKPKAADVTPARRLSPPDGRSRWADLVYCGRAIAGRERQRPSISGAIAERIGGSDELHHAKIPSSALAFCGIGVGMGLVVFG